MHWTKEAKGCLPWVICESQGTDWTCQAEGRKTPATGRNRKDYYFGLLLSKNKMQRKHISNLTKENKMTMGGAAVSLPDHPMRMA